MTSSIQTFLTSPFGSNFEASIPNGIRYCLYCHLVCRDVPYWTLFGGGLSTEKVLFILSSVAGVKLGETYGLSIIQRTLSYLRSKNPLTEAQIEKIRGTRPVATLAFIVDAIPQRICGYLSSKCPITEAQMDKIRRLKPIAALAFIGGVTWVASVTLSFISKQFSAGYLSLFTQGCIYFVHHEMVLLAAYAPDDLKTEGFFSVRNTLPSEPVVHSIPIPDSVVQVAKQVTDAALRTTNSVNRVAKQVTDAALRATNSVTRVAKQVADAALRPTNLVTRVAKQAVDPVVAMANSVPIPRCVVRVANLVAQVPNWAVQVASWVAQAPNSVIQLANWVIQVPNWAVQVAGSESFMFDTEKGRPENRVGAITSLTATIALFMFSLISPFKGLTALALSYSVAAVTNVLLEKKVAQHRDMQERMSANSDFLSDSEGFEGDGLGLAFNEDH